MARSRSRSRGRETLKLTSISGELLAELDLDEELRADFVSQVKLRLGERLGCPACRLQLLSVRPTNSATSWESCGRPRELQLLRVPLVRDYHEDLVDAVGLQCVARVREILERGQDPSFSGDGKPAVFHAVASANLEILLILRAAGAEMDPQDRVGASPLFLASQLGFEAAARLLLDSGAEVNRVAENGITACHIAARNGHPSLVQVLIQSGADMNRSSEDGFAPLHVAALYGQADVVAALVKLGADVNKTIETGFTSLHLAACNGHAGVVRALVEAGADINASIDDSFTPLHVAAVNGHESMVHTLVQVGMDVNKASKDGFTPLHVAALYGQEPVVRALLGFKADALRRLETGLAARQLAQRNAHGGVARLLAEAEAAASEEVEPTEPVLAETKEPEGSGAWSWSLRLFEQLGSWRLSADQVSCCTAITACQDEWQRVLGFLSEMQLRKLEKNQFVYSAAISALSAVWQLALSLFLEMRAARMQPNAVVRGATISACKSWTLSLHLLEGAPSVKAAAACGAPWQCSLRLLARLRGRCLRLDTAAFHAAGSADWRLSLAMPWRHLALPAEPLAHSLAVTACGEMGLWERSADVLLAVFQQTIQADLILHNSVLSAYAAGVRFRARLTESVKPTNTAKESELKSQLRCANQRFLELQSEKDNALNIVQSVAKERNELKVQLQAAQRRALELQSERETALGDIQSAAREKHELKSQLQSSRQSLSWEVQKAKLFVQERDELNLQLHSSNQRFLQLHSEKEHALNDIANLAKERDELKGQLETTHQRFSDWQREKEAVLAHARQSCQGEKETAIKAAHQRCLELKSENEMALKSAHQKCLQSQIEKEMALKTVQSMSKERDQLKLQLHAADRSFSAELHKCLNLAAERDELKSQLDSASQKSVQLQIEKDHALSSIKTLSKEISELSFQLSSGRYDIAVAKSREFCLQQDKKSTESELVFAKQRAEELEADNHRLRRERSDLKSQLQDANQRAGDLT
ncbi:unnamed protein product, partial [Effrenium voratum]